MSKSLVCKIVPREGYVYRNYMCKGCNKTAEFFGVKKDEENTKSVTSRRYRCPECFPADVNGVYWNGDVGILTEEYAGQSYFKTKFIDDKIEELHKGDGFVSGVISIVKQFYTRDGGQKLEEEGREYLRTRNYYLATI